MEDRSTSVSHFAFVVHPLDVGFIHRHRGLAWTRALPDGLVERVAARMPPFPVSRITGARSPATGQRVEGHLIALSATPRQMLARPARFTYDRLRRAARLAERLECRIMGLGAFTSVVGDAGETVAREAGIAVTSGNSLTVAMTLESARVALRGMGVEELSGVRAMVVGATGSIGAACARLVAMATRDVVLVSIEPEKLAELRRTIETETPGARVVTATRPEELAGDCPLVLTATSAFGQRVLDITRLRPGAVVCDVARPCDISASEAALRPDVLVIESGEVVIPGAPDFGYDIGLPPGSAYACLAETALLAMEGRFESFTLGRRIEPQRVREIEELAGKHGFRLAGLRSFGRPVTPADLAEKRSRASALLADRQAFVRLQRAAAAALAEIPPLSKGVSAGRGGGAWLGAGVSALDSGAGRALPGRSHR